jgi:hypothetical protein
MKEVGRAARFFPRAGRSKIFRPLLRAGAKVLNCESLGRLGDGLASDNSPYHVN